MIIAKMSAAYQELTAAAVYACCHEVIWQPDAYTPEEVAEAAEYVLAMPGAPSADVHQASCLLTAYRWSRKLRTALHGGM